MVVHEHGDTVFRVCRALVGPHDAEDAWSEAFLAALIAYPRLRPDSDVKAWLITIAHRKAIDKARANARAPLPLAQMPDEATFDRNPAERDLELWTALAELPTKQRGAIACHYVADLPYALVATVLETSEAAARRSAADGIASLRKTLSKDTSS